MTLSSSSKKLIIIMLIITLIGVFIAYNYYGYINSLEDPRIYHIREMLLRYNQAVSNNETKKALTLLDSMDNEYSKIKHYKDSFERGVLNTSKASVFITKALYQSRDDDEKLNYLERAELCLKKSIEYYDNWKNIYDQINNIDLKNKITDEFNDVESDHKEEIVNKRMIDINFALNELNKRYSVTYTNLGVVIRHKLFPDSAVVFYKKALELWPENNTAKSNLNVLMGGEPIKKSFIDKLLPDERE